MVKNMKSKYFVFQFDLFLIFIAILTVLTTEIRAEYPDSQNVPNLLSGRESEKTSFQQAGNYHPDYDVRSDIVMAYGVSDAAIDGLELWREKSGARVSVMTGVAWGSYNDFLDGNFDGLNHWDDAQINASGNQVLHSPNIPYIVPSIAFCDYLDNRLKKVIDAGIDTIFLEEPELWAFAGFGESFQREWSIFYNTPFIRPDTNCDAQYRSSKLKQYLYTRLLDRLCSSLKEYSLKKYNRPLRVYIATHSLISYAQIKMVSPESALIDLPGIDGLIAQIWTGTSRFPNIYNGIRKERVFESAFLEYNVMQEMMRGTGKRVYFLNDPVEDDPQHNWDDYKTCYLSTLVASLMQSDTCYYEVAPWPSRIFLGTYPAGDPEASRIPDDYASTLTLTFQQLRDMEQQDIHWDKATEGIGILLSDSAMFQRAAPATSEGTTNAPTDASRQTTEEVQLMNGFFGLVIPLIKHGVPVDVPILDHLLRFPGYLDRYRVLILSYEFQKPLKPGLHSTLVDWVNRGGTLIYVGAETDPFHQVEEWWNTGKSDYKTPAEHLMEAFNLGRSPEEGVYPFGKGWVVIDREHPANIARIPKNSDKWRKTVAESISHYDEQLIEKNYFLKYRGPYLLISVMDESVSDEPLCLSGNYINLFDPRLAVQHEIQLLPNQCGWLLDLDRISSNTPLMLASSGRIESWNVTEHRLEYTLSSPAKLFLISRIRLASKPSQILVDGQPCSDTSWDEETRTLYLRHRTETGSTNVVIEW